MQSTYGEFGNVYADPKKELWDEVPGEADPKSKFVQDVFLSFALTLSGAFLIIILGLSNKSLGKGLENPTWFLVSIGMVAGIGALLYLRKEVRDQSFSIWIFGLWALCVAVAIATTIKSLGNSNFIITIFFAKAVAACCCYLGATRTKKIEDLKKNSVVGFIMSMIVLLFAICIKEQ